MAELPRRILKETERMSKEPGTFLHSLRCLECIVPGISCIPYKENPRYFKIIIAGPEGTPYEGGVFRCEMFLPDGYPMCPPKMRFLTKIYQ
jgi:ubiquitin-conjugating enzyme E2 N